MSVKNEVDISVHLGDLNLYLSMYDCLFPRRQLHPSLIQSLHEKILLHVHMQIHFIVLVMAPCLTYCNFKKIYREFQSSSIVSILNSHTTIHNFIYNFYRFINLIFMKNNAFKAYNIQLNELMYTKNIVVMSTNCKKYIKVFLLYFFVFCYIYTILLQLDHIFVYLRDLDMLVS